MLSVKQGGIKYQFLVFGITRPGIEPRYPEPLTNTLPSRTNIYIYIYMEMILFFTNVTHFSFEMRRHSVLECENI